MKPIEEQLREFADHVAAFVDELPDGEYKGLGRLRLMLREIAALLAQPTGDAAPRRELPMDVQILLDAIDRLMSIDERDEAKDDIKLVCEVAKKAILTRHSWFVRPDGGARYIDPMEADAVAAERERCAKLVEAQLPYRAYFHGLQDLLDAIRATPASDPQPTPEVVDENQCAIEGCKEEAIWDSVCEKHQRPSPAPATPTQEDVVKFRESIDELIEWAQFAFGPSRGSWPGSLYDIIESIEAALKGAK
jgi:hypothetical protein